MKDRTKKYKMQGDAAYPHVGGMLTEYFEQHHTNRAELSRNLGIALNGVQKYQKHGSLQLGILWKIGLVLKHNFFGVMAEKFPVPHVTEKETALLQQLAEKEQEISDLKKEIALYKGILVK